MGFAADRGPLPPGAMEVGEQRLPGDLTPTETRGGVCEAWDPQRFISGGQTPSISHPGLNRLVNRFIDGGGSTS
jgi:hypothetical protein